MNLDNLPRPKQPIWQPIKIVVLFVAFLLAIYLLIGVGSMAVGIWQGMNQNFHVTSTIKLPASKGPYNPQYAKQAIKSDRVISKILKQDKELARKWQENVKAEKTGSNCLKIRVKVWSGVSNKKVKKITSVALSNFLNEARNYYRQKQSFNSQQIKHYKNLKEEIKTSLKKKDKLTAKTQIELKEKKLRINKKLIKEKQKLYRRLPPRIEIKPHLVTAKK